MKVILAPRAEDDLEAIGDFIALDNPGRAASYTDELLAKCETLSTLPERFPLVSRYIGKQVRRCLHGRYLILYRVETEVVRVIHIVHAASDYEVLVADD
jgi:toxin ParE1/3/4